MMKNIKSLYTRNLLSSILLISHLLLGVVFSAFCYNYIMRDQRKNLDATAEEVSRMVSAYCVNWEMGGLNMRVALSGFAETSGFDIILFDLDGVCVSCSDRRIDCPHIGRHMDEDLLQTLWFNGNLNASAKGDLGGILDNKAYYTGKTVEDFIHGGTIGYVFLTLNNTFMRNMWQEFILLYFMVAVIIIVIAIGITGMVTKMQTTPIDEMADAANKFAHGDFSVRVSESERRDEIGALAEAFNMMADTLEKSETKRREFVSNVSHELKTPITTITGFADGILDGTIPPEQEREYLELVSSEAKRMSRLVRGMLDASRVQEVDSQEILSKSFDIIEVVSVALLSLEKKITDKGLDVEVSMPEEPLIVRGESDNITQVVYNLLDNAAKFAKTPSVLKIEVWKEKNKVYVSVENEGETIPRDELTVIFDRFHKTDKSRSMDKDGVGLGLYIVKTILDSHGEDIFVKSEDGVTKFTFTLTPVGSKGRER